MEVSLDIENGGIIIRGELNNNSIYLAPRGTAFSYIFIKSISEGFDSIDRIYVEVEMDDVTIYKIGEEELIMTQCYGGAIEIIDQITVSRSEFFAKSILATKHFIDKANFDKLGNSKHIHNNKKAWQKLYEKLQFMYEK